MERKLSQEQLHQRDSFLKHFLNIGGFNTGSEFMWKLHEKYLQIPPAPFYSDFRVLQRHPQVMRRAVALYKEKTWETIFDLLAPVPQGAIHITTALSQSLLVGTVTPRLDRKDHGKKNQVEGMRESDKGRAVLLVDDVASTGDSKLDAINLLEEEELIVNGVLVGIDYGIVASEELMDKGYPLFSVFTLDQVVETYERLNAITAGEAKEIIDWRDHTKIVVSNHLRDNRLAHV